MLVIFFLMSQSTSQGEFLIDLAKLLWVLKTVLNKIVKDVFTLGLHVAPKTLSGRKRDYYRSSLQVLSENVQCMQKKLELFYATGYLNKWTFWHVFDTTGSLVEILLWALKKGSVWIAACNGVKLLNEWHLLLSLKRTVGQYFSQRWVQIVKMTQNCRSSLLHDCLIPLCQI